MCRSAGRADEALDLYKKALRIRLNDAEVLCNIGTLYHMKSQMMQAESYYKRSLKHSGRQKEARCNLAILYSDGGQLEKGREQFEIAHRDFPGDSMILQRLGKVQAMLGDVQAARASYEKAVRLNPSDAVSRAALRTLTDKQVP